MAEEKEVKGKAADEKLLAAACEAYGIDQKYVIGSAVKDGVAIVVTNGGKKVRFKAGDKVEKLDSVAVTGINPTAKKRKPITGPGKE